MAMFAGPGEDSWSSFEHGVLFFVFANQPVWLSLYLLRSREEADRQPYVHHGITMAFGGVSGG